MNNRPAVHKSIGWAVRPGDDFAHYYNPSRLGLVAVSMCWITNNPEDLRPAYDHQYCQVCKTMLERKESEQKANSE